MTATLTPAASTPAEPQMKEEGGAGAKTFNRLAATCMVLFGLIWLVPFVFAVITSLRPDNEITANPSGWWSNNWTLKAYTSALHDNPILRWYLNSFIIAT